MGPLDKVSELLGHLRAFVDSDTASQASFVHVQPAPPSPPASSANSVPAVSQVPLQAERPSLSRATRRELERSLPECPQYWLNRAGSLRASNGLSGRDRIARAWRAGAWAKLVLAGQVGTPLPSPTLSAPNRFYCVLGGGDVQPILYSSYRAYREALGPLEQSPAVSHGFLLSLSARSIPPPLACHGPCKPRGPSPVFGLPPAVHLRARLRGWGWDNRIFSSSCARSGARVSPCIAFWVLADEEVAAGLIAPMDALLGPTHLVECPAAFLSATGLLPAPGSSVTLNLQKALLPSAHSTEKVLQNWS